MAEADEIMWVEVQFSVRPLTLMLRPIFFVCGDLMELKIRHDESKFASWHLVEFILPALLRKQFPYAVVLAVADVDISRSVYTNAVWSC